MLSVDLPVHGRRPDPWQLEILGHEAGDTVGASIEVAVASTPMLLSDLLSRADAAMYVQKRERASGVG